MAKRYDSRGHWLEAADLGPSFALALVAPHGLSLRPWSFAPTHHGHCCVEVNVFRLLGETAPPILLAAGHKALSKQVARNGPGLAKMCMNVGLPESLTYESRGGGAEGPHRGHSENPSEIRTPRRQAEGISVTADEKTSFQILGLHSLG